MKINSMNEVNIALRNVAEKQSIVAKLEAEMNSKINAIKEKFEEKTKDANGIINMLLADIEAFCIKNKIEFEKQRSIELQFGKVGFRNNPPKVSTLNRKYTFKTALELVKRIFEGKYIRVKEELDKETILADYAGKSIDDSSLAAVGLKIDQDESFFTEVFWEKLQEEPKL